MRGSLGWEILSHEPLSGVENSEWRKTCATTEATGTFKVQPRQRIEIKSCYFTNVSSSGCSGGGLRILRHSGNTYTAKIYDTSFSICRVSGLGQNGGAFCVDDGCTSLTVDLCHFDECSSENGDGGAFYSEATFSPLSAFTLSLSSTSFERCSGLTTSSNGVMSITASMATVTRCTMHACIGGSKLSITNSLTVSDSCFTATMMSAEGAIVIVPQLTITDTQDTVTTSFSNCCFNTTERLIEPTSSPVHIVLKIAGSAVFIHPMCFDLTKESSIGGFSAGGIEVQGEYDAFNCHECEHRASKQFAQSSAFTETNAFTHSDSLTMSIACSESDSLVPRTQSDSQSDSQSQSESDSLSETLPVHASSSSSASSVESTELTTGCTRTIEQIESSSSLQTDEITSISTGNSHVSEHQMSKAESSSEPESDGQDVPGQQSQPETAASASEAKSASEGPSSDSDSGGLSAGAIAGIVIAIVVVIVALILILVFVMKKKKNEVATSEKASGQEMNETNQTPVSIMTEEMFVTIENEDAENFRDQFETNFEIDMEEAMDH